MVGYVDELSDVVHPHRPRSQLDRLEAWLDRVIEEGRTAPMACRPWDGA